MDFKDKQNLPTIFSSDPAAIAAAESAKARIQTAYLMALHKPRVEDQARVRILEACKRPKFAERVEFSKPVGTRKIRGPSVRFAELALREWGNIDTETQVVYEDDHIRRIKVRLLDLETNTGFSRELQIKKTVERKSRKDREVVGERTNTKGENVYIVVATDDELENKQNALISKAVRNEGLRLIPSDITDEAIETATATMRNKFAEDPKAEKKKIIDSFSEIGIKPKNIEGYLKHSIDTISPPELQGLRGMYRAIRDGEATWASYLEEKEPEKSQDASDLTDKIKEKAEEMDQTEKPEHHQLWSQNQQKQAEMDQKEEAGKAGAVVDAEFKQEDKTSPVDKQDSPPDAERQNEDLKAATKKQDDLNERLLTHGIDPALAKVFGELTNSSDAGIFWRMREKGLDLFFDTFEDAMKTWPKEIQDFMMAKCKNIAGKHPEFVERLEKAIAIVTDFPALDGDIPKADDDENWNGLYYDCPNMDGKPIPRAACKTCDRREGCPTPFIPKQAKQEEMKF